MPPVEADHGHGETISSDKGMERYAFGKARSKRESNERIVLEERKIWVPCLSECDGTGEEGVYKQQVDEGCFGYLVPT